jgi:hypothetical protein
VVEVKLHGLKIARARGKWYVYRRSTGEVLIKGLAGDRGALLREMAAPEFIRVYNLKRAALRAAKDHTGDTLGGLLYWYTNGDIDRCRDERSKFVVPELQDKPPADAYPKWRTLAKATHADYLEAFDYLRDAFTIQLSEITQPDLYELRDQCANAKWPRFADQMIAALSSAFKHGVKRGNSTGLKVNPCLGMDKAHQADPNSNREWFAHEWKFVRENAPMEVLIPCMTARYIGLSGQTIVGLNERQFLDDPDGPTGRAIQYTRRKNKKSTLLPVTIEFQTFLTERKLQSSDGLIAIRDDGSRWPSEKEMQTRVSHWLRDREREGKIGAGTTLHGLRVSYAAWWKRNGASNSEVAELIGDKSEAMGGHYTRHVESEININRAFDRIKARDQK